MNHLREYRKVKLNIENQIKSMLGKDYYREVVVIDEKGNVVERFKNKSEYYKGMHLKYNVGRSFLELWLKNNNECLNPKKLDRFKCLERKRALYFDEFITENV